MGVLICSLTYYVSEYIYFFFILQSSKLIYNISDNNTNNDIIFIITTFYFKLFKDRLVSILDYSMIFNLIFMYMTIYFFLINHQDTIIELIIFMSASMTLWTFVVFSTIFSRLEEKVLLIQTFFIHLLYREKESC